MRRRNLERNGLSESHFPLKFFCRRTQQHTFFEMDLINILLPLGLTFLVRKLGILLQAEHDLILDLKINDPIRPSLEFLGRRKILAAFGRAPGMTLKIVYLGISFKSENFKCERDGRLRSNPEPQKQTHCNHEDDDKGFPITRFLLRLFDADVHKLVYITSTNLSTIHNQSRTKLTYKNRAVPIHINF